MFEDACDAMRRSMTDETTPPKLQDEQVELLLLLANGEQIRSIAETLDLSEGGVLDLIRRTVDDLQCETMSHAVATAMRRGLIT